MSMNLHVEAVATVEFPNGKKKQIKETFLLWQTPTEVTRRILNSNDIPSEYSMWVDTFNCGMGDEHIDELNEWITEHEGWKIEWYMI